MAWLAGPQPWAFWNNTLDTLSLASHLLIEPLRICVVASTFVYCVERVAHTATTSDAPESAPSSL